MIKLRQINHSTVCVTRGGLDDNPHVKKEYSLSDIWVNPHSILYLQLDNALTDENKEKPLIEDLDQNHTFTKLFISENGFARQLVVVGDPESISEQVESYTTHGK